MHDTSAANAWALDPRLERDTVAVGDLPLCRVLVIDDATYPWLLLVPRRRGTSEIVDLGEADRVQLMAEIARASDALKAIVPCEKLNVAALGNVVAQLHVHVIVRRRDDPAWPKPVWGAVPARPYGKEELATFLERLRRALGLG